MSSTEQAQPAVCAEECAAKTKAAACQPDGSCPCPTTQAEKAESPDHVDGCCGGKSCPPKADAPATAEAWSKINQSINQYNIQFYKSNIGNYPKFFDF